MNALSALDEKPSTPLSVGIVQMRVDPDDKEANLVKLENLFYDLVNGFPYVDLVLFGELYAHGIAGENTFEKNPEPFPGPMSDRFCKMARNAGKWLCPGTQWERKNNKVYNLCYLINPKGEIVLEYRKMQPWKPGEPTTPHPENFAVYEIPGKCKVGLIICYDILFPEMARAIALQGAEVLLHPTLHMDPLQLQFAISERAAAVHNQCYVVTCCGCGMHGGYSIAGHSMFVNPSGHILWEGGNSEQTAVQILDIDEVRRAREYGTEGLMPMLKHLHWYNYRFPQFEGFRKMPLYDEIGRAQESPEDSPKTIGW